MRKSVHGRAMADGSLLDEVLVRQKFLDVPADFTKRLRIPRLFARPVSAKRSARLPRLL
ncbi:MAG: hypothetical protein LBQ62_01960 [Candidatus Accumulibacter sp.]|nr:hypothetical protein [Accumulibacter sp.]